MVRGIGNALGGPPGVSPDLTLPNAHHGPSGVCRRLGVPGVPLHIGRDLGLPARGVRPAEVPCAVGGAAVPEAAVDKDRDGVPGQYEVGRAARSDLTVQSKAEPEGVDCAPEGLFRFGVPYAAASELCTPGRAHPSFVCAHKAMLSPWAATPWACSGWQTA